MAAEERWGPQQALEAHGAAWQHAEEACALFDAVGSGLDAPTFLAGETTPVFVGSALTNFGVRTFSMPSSTWPRRRPVGLMQLGR